jgi:hypothetical protein
LPDEQTVARSCSTSGPLKLNRSGADWLGGRLQGHARLHAAAGTGSPSMRSKRSYAGLGRTVGALEKAPLWCCCTAAATVLHEAKHATHHTAGWTCRARSRWQVRSPCRPCRACRACRTCRTWAGCSRDRCTLGRTCRPCRTGRRACSTTCRRSGRASRTRATPEPSTTWDGQARQPDS